MNNLTVTFDTTSKKPLYEQLYAHIAEEIKCQHLKEGERLPSKKSLSSHLKVSLNTVESAYQMLVQEGYVYAVPRSGFYVCKVEAGAGRNAEPILVEEELREKPDYKVDFKTNAVDIESFPYATWIRLSKGIMYGNPDLLSAGEAQGDLVLRQSIVKHLRELRGVRCSPAQVIVGAGMEYLLMLLTEILGEGNRFAVEDPGYRKIENVLKNSGGEVHYIPVDHHGMQTKALKRTDANIVYITPSHQFPTGAVMPVGRRMELLSWAAGQEGRYIIEDDYNSEFHFNGRPIPAVQGLDSWNKVIYLSTFSRILAPSIRIAYMVLPPQLLQIYRQRFGGYSSTVPRFDQHTLSKFMEEGYLARHLNRVKGIYKKRRDTLLSMLGRIQVEVSGENAGLHLLIRMPSAGAVKSFLKTADKHKIKFYLLDDYYFTPQKKPANTLIAGYAGVNEEQIKWAAKLLMQWSER